MSGLSVLAWQLFAKTLYNRRTRAGTREHKLCCHDSKSFIWQPQKFVNWPRVSLRNCGYPDQPALEKAMLQVFVSLLSAELG